MSLAGLQPLRACKICWEPVRHHDSTQHCTHYLHTPTCTLLPALGAAPAVAPCACCPCGSAAPCWMHPRQPHLTKAQCVHGLVHAKMFLQKLALHAMHKPRPVTIVTYRLCSPLHASPSCHACANMCSTGLRHAHRCFIIIAVASDGVLLALCIHAA